MKLIHYSSERITLEPMLYDQSRDKWQAKPVGLWVSIEDEWKKWCESENYRTQTCTHSHEVILKPNHSVLHLKTAEEVTAFGKKYPLRTRDWDAEYDTYQLDWHTIKKEYQGIIIAPYQWSCRLALESCWYYGWDCASGCIWDLDSIESFAFMEEIEMCGVCNE